MITVNNKFFNQQWGLKLINIEDAWGLLNNSQPLNGSLTEKAFGSPNINVIIVDNGVETNNNISVHKSFHGQTTNGNPKFLKNIALENNTYFDFKDYLIGSHGMGVSGIAMAKAQVNNLSAYNGEGIVGVAPNCSFYSITTEKDIQFKLLSMFGLAGLEFTSPSQDVLNDAYNINTDRILISPLMKQRGTLNAGSNLNFFLNGVYADVFNLSLKILSSPNLITENYSKIIFNEMSFFGRKGRGCVSIIGAGNDGQDIEPRPNEFLNELASSNKPMIVGAVSVDNTYNWLTNNPPANAKKSNYSNYGARIDICAPGGGEIDAPGFPPALGIQNKNLIFSTTVKGAGDLYSNSPLKLTLKTKVNARELNPIDPDHYDFVVLEFDNSNGLFEGQRIILGEFSTFNNYEMYYVNGVFPSNQIAIKGMKKSTYSNLVDSSGTGTKSILEFSPMFTKIVAIISNKIIKVENTKGAFASTTDEIYIGTLGDSSSGNTRNVRSVNPTTNEITLVSNITANVGDYVVFPKKNSKIFSGNTNGSKKIVVQNTEGFFPGGLVYIEESDSYSTITSVDVSTRTINLQDPLLYSSTITSGTKYVKNIATGDITTEFNGTSAATPFVSGVAALVLSANNNLSAAEVKHILQKTASSSKTTSGEAIPSYSLNSDGYMHNTHYGTGLVDAGAAVQLALNWHTSTTLQKPKMEIADKLNANVIVNVPVSDPVISPDIWIKPFGDTTTTLPTESMPINTITTLDDQIIYVRVRNTGNRQSFKECDLRVLIAFTDEDNPAFPFPTKWYDQPDVKLLAVKEIPIIDPGSKTIIQVEWKNIAAFWDNFNPLPTTDGILTPGGLRKRAYILTHIAPFDGLEIDVLGDNIRKNKQLSCKEIIVTHNGVNNRTSYIPGNKLNITVGTDVIEKFFDLTIENILASELATLKIKATRKNRLDHTTEELIYKKTGTVWALENGSPDWIAFQTPTETTSVHPNYKNVTFPHKLTINEEEEEIKLEIINA